jgi:hypothetical protein
MSTTAIHTTDDTSSLTRLLEGRWSCRDFRTRRAPVEDTVTWTT